MFGEGSRYAWMIDADNNRSARRHMALTNDRLQQLTPAGKRLLTLLLNTFNANYGMSLNRRQIALLLGRPSKGLTPHDRKLLNTLCELGLLRLEKETLWTPEHFARGMEFRYSMDEDTAWILNTMRRMVRKRRRSRKAG